MGKEGQAKVGEIGSWFHRFCSGSSAASLAPQARQVAKLMTAPVSCLSYFTFKATKEQPYTSRARLCEVQPRVMHRSAQGLLFHQLGTKRDASRGGISTSGLI